MLSSSLICMVHLLLASVGHDRVINILQKLVVVRWLVREGNKGCASFRNFSSFE